MESPLALVLLGLIASATIVQTVLLVTLAVKGQRLAARLAALEKDLLPRLDRLGVAIDNVTQVTDGVLRHLPEVESTLEDTLQKVRRTTGIVEALVLKPLAPLAAALALWRGLKRGTTVYRQLRAGSSMQS